MAAYFSMNATIIYFARYVLDNPEMIVAIVVARKLLGMLVSISLTQWLVKLSGRRKGVFIAGLCVYIGGFIALYSVRTTNAYAIFALFSLISVGQVLVSSMALALQADTVEFGEYVSGERLEGMSYAFFSFSRKCGQALGGALMPRVDFSNNLRKTMFGERIERKNRQCHCKQSSWDQRQRAIYARDALWGLV